MCDFLTIGEAARAAGVTSETLRHYDRIDLVVPSRRDPWTHYRYYASRDIVRLRAVNALQQLGLPLSTIREALDCNDFRRIAAFLADAERQADEKIALLRESKRKIALARRSYERRLDIAPQAEGAHVQRFDERVILLSDTLETPTMENLWGYLRHFYRMIGPSRRDEFEFEDAAGIYTANGMSRLYAVCVRCGEIAGLRRLPRGDYLCMACTEDDRLERRAELLECAWTRHHVRPEFVVQAVVLSGILQWNYQLQVFLGGGQ